MNMSGPRRLDFGSALRAAIDRHALVSRHDPIATRTDFAAPLSVGNGGFAFSVNVAAAAGAPRPARPEIAVYLPANGAVLSAVALMVAGWDGCRVEHPGFPRDGSWHIAAEGWSRLP